MKNWDACAEQLRAALGQQQRSLARAVLRRAEWTDAAGAGTAGTVRLLTDAEPETAPASHVYKTLRLSTHSLAGPRLVEEIVAELQRGAEAFQYAYWERRDRLVGGDRLEWPHWELRISLDDSQRPTNEAVVAFGEPPFSDAHSAVSHWLGDDRWSPGEWRIQVPDLRARLGPLRFAGDGALHLTVDSSFAAGELEVQVVFGTSLTRDRGRARAVVTGDPLSIQAPEGSEHADVFLVTRDHEVLDREQHVRREAVERTEAEQLELAEQCRRDIAGGEGEHVELKPWIVPKDPKENEVVRTIVAFANTHGGRLYVGVAASGSPQGRNELFKAFKSGPGRPPVEPTQAAREWLRGSSRRSSGAARTSRTRSSRCTASLCCASWSRLGSNARTRPSITTSS
jgi:hypothetical protein